MGHLVRSEASIAPSLVAISCMPQAVSFINKLNRFAIAERGTKRDWTQRRLCSILGWFNFNCDHLGMPTLEFIFVSETKQLAIALDVYFKLRAGLRCLH